MPQVVQLGAVKLACEPWQTSPRRCALSSDHPEPIALVPMTLQI